VNFKVLYLAKKLCDGTIVIETRIICLNRANFRGREIRLAIG